MNKDPRPRIWVIDDFLPTDYFNQLHSLVMSTDLPWFYGDRQLDKHYNEANESSQNQIDFHFTHIIYGAHEPHSFLWDHVRNITDYLDFHVLWRIKLNLNVKWSSNITYGLHNDLHRPALAGILYFNTNDGPTVFDSGEKVEAKENRFLVFDATYLHSGISHTNTKRRVVMNIVWLPDGDMYSDSFIPVQSKGKMLNLAKQQITHVT